MPDFPSTLKTPRLATAPSSPTPGQMYYDTSASKLYYWNGTAWVEGGSGGGSSVVISSTAGIVRARRSGNAALANVYGGPHSFTIEDVDTDNVWDGTRFKPTKSGWYEVRTHLYIGMGSGQQGTVVLVKNHSGALPWAAANELGNANPPTPYGAASVQYSVTAVVYLNGSSDYVEVFTWMPDGGRTLYGSPGYTSYFEASSLPSVGPKGDKGDPWVPSTYTLDTWHTVGAAGEPAFQNSWANSGSWAPLAFKKDPFGRVRIRGTIGTGTSGTVVFTLPVGYRPTAAVPYQITLGDGSRDFTSIQTDGTVTVFRSGTSTYLADIEFDTDSVTTMLAGPQGLGLPAGGTSGSILQKKSATDYDTEWLTPTNARQVQHVTNKVGPFHQLTTALPSAANRVDFPVVPGTYKVLMWATGYNNPAGVTFWSYYAKRPEDGAGVAWTQGATTYLGTANYHFLLTPVTGEVVVGTAGTLSLWPAWGGATDVNDSWGCMLIPKDVTGPAGPKGDPWVPSTYTMDTWHVVGDATTGLGTAFKSASWSHYVPGQYPRVAFKKDPFGKVRLRGMMSSGATGIAFTLPAGYRPGSDVVSVPRAHHVGNNAGAFGTIAIDTNGDVNVPAGTWVDVSAVEFDTDSVTTMLAGVKGDTGPRGPAGDAPVALPLDTWHIVGAAGEPPFLNGWVSIDAPRRVMFRKDPFGRVFIRGVAASGTAATAVFNLPAGYRPAQEHVEVNWTSATPNSQAITVQTGGNVIASISGYSFLDGVYFDTDTVTTVLGGAQGPPGPAGSLNAPQYDSGWVLEQSASAHGTTLTHNLNLKRPPSNVEWWFAPTVNAQAAGDWFLLNLPNMKVTPAQTGGDPYSNPGAVAFRTNEIFYYIYNGSSLYSYYSGGWVNWANGYYRVYLWT